jgi:hypothetical protein
MMYFEIDGENYTGKQLLDRIKCLEAENAELKETKKTLQLTCEAFRGDRKRNIDRISELVGALEEILLIEDCCSCDERMDGETCIYCICKQALNKDKEEAI